MSLVPYPKFIIKFRVHCKVRSSMGDCHSLDRAGLDARPGRFIDSSFWFWITLINNKFLDNRTFAKSLYQINNFDSTANRGCWIQVPSIVKYYLTIVSMTKLEDLCCRHQMFFSLLNTSFCGNSGLENNEVRQSYGSNTNIQKLPKISSSQFLDIEFGFRMEWMDSFCPSWYTTQRAIQPIQQ